MAHGGHPAWKGRHHSLGEPDLVDSNWLHFHGLRRSLPQFKTILITGASGGIGAALARALAAPGVTLLLWGRDAARLAETAAACRALGAVCQTQAFDHSRRAGAGRAIWRRPMRRTPIDLAIFNAGLGGMPDTTLAEAPQAALATAEVNFVAPVVGANAIAAPWRARRRGRIVLVGSIAESFPLPHGADLCRHQGGAGHVRRGAVASAWRSTAWA